MPRRAILIELGCSAMIALVMASPAHPNALRHDGTTALPWPQCRYLQSDPDWPSQVKWQALNNSVTGRLIATVPLAAPCHAPQYDEVACVALRQAWPYPQTHFNSSSSINAPYFQNQSCSPFTASDETCALGNLVSYAIDVRSAQDVAFGLRFCRANNIRPVIKNTGHDFLGRSTGASGLGFWTHNLKSSEYLTYQSAHYTGPAMKFGAGLQVWEAYQAAAAHGVRPVGGECPTVGLVGGFAQGGGHGPLSSTEGLGADNVLEWEVVTPDGQHIVATPTHHPDLYWALSGGGPGNLGVVLSMTQRVAADDPISAANLRIQAADVAPDDYWAAIALWHAALPALAAQGATSAYLFNAELFEVQYVTFPNRSADEVRDLMAPVVVGLREKGIPYSMNISIASGLVDFVGAYVGLPYGDDPSNQVTGSRLVPRSVIASDNDRLTAALRDICADSRFTVLAVALDVSRAPDIANAVLPAWRDTALHLILRGTWNYTAPWLTNVDVQAALTDTQLPRLESLTPGSGSYMNEGNFEQPDWQSAFYGANYGRLSALKRRYDPEGLLYVVKGAGSEDWATMPDGRLCRTASP